MGWNSSGQLPLAERSSLSRLHNCLKLPEKFPKVWRGVNSQDAFAFVRQNLGAQFVHVLISNLSRWYVQIHSTLHNWVGDLSCHVGISTVKIWEPSLINSLHNVEWHCIIELEILWPSLGWELTWEEVVSIDKFAISTLSRNPSHLHKDTICNLNSWISPISTKYNFDNISQTSFLLNSHLWPFRLCKENTPTHLQLTQSPRQHWYKRCYVSEVKIGHRF